MEEQTHAFTDAEELCDYLKSQDIFYLAKKSDYQMILNYMEGHGYSLGTDSAGNFCRIDTNEKIRETEPYTMDEAIDAACEWNYELIRETAAALEEETDKETVERLEADLASLRREEARLDKLFDQTKYPAELDKLAAGIAEAFLERLGVTGVDRAVEELGESMRSRSAGGGAR
jgi:hypothetical protein